MTLRRHRLARGLTQHQLARKAGISTRALWSIEHGVQPRQFTKRRLLLALGIDWARRNEVFPR
jgi:transcriptional regulator with XRE-family HTH domain